MIAEDHELIREVFTQGIIHYEPKASVGFSGHKDVPGSLDLNPIESLVSLSSVQAVGDPQADVPNEENKNEAQQSDN
jgi:hypothetical protein